MNLYDDMIARCQGMMDPFPCKQYNIPEGIALKSGEQTTCDETFWEQENEQHILFKKDTAYELGGSGLPAYSGVAFTSNETIKDEIVICGPDLTELKADSPYARLTILRVDDNAWADNGQAYRVLRRLDYTRYHVHPKGFLMRISAAAHREPVRVGKEALQSGLDFERVGRLFLNAYHSHPEVLGVRIFFITEPDFPYEEFRETVCQMDSVTESLNEIFNNLIMDCSSCRLKPVCDEVEGLRELHFAVKKEMSIQ